MKILKINPSTLLRVYPWHLFINAIASNEDNTGKKLATILIDNFAKNSWTIDKSHAEFIYEFDKVALERNIYKGNLTAYIYRKCEINDEIIINVEYQQYSDFWAGISLFIGYQDDINEMEDDDNLINYEIMRCSGGYVYSHISNNDPAKKLFYVGKQGIYPYWLKLKKNNQNITSYISNDNETWDFIESYNLTNSQRDSFTIGICFNYAWFMDMMMKKFMY